MSTNYIDQITDTAGTTHDISEGDSTRIFRATCSTAASTAAKVATLQTSSRNFSLTTGVRVAVTFTYGNSAATPTLRVDGSSTGTAKTIVTPTAVATLTNGNGTTYNTWGPYETVIFTYNGTYWINGGSSLSIYNSYNYNNLSNKPTIPTLPSNIVNTITTTAGTHTAITNQKGDVSFNVPTKTSHLTNDSGFITTDSDENVKSTAIASAMTNYIVGSTTSTTTTGSLSKHASAVMYTTADSGTSGYTQLRLGNTTATSSAGGKEGQIRLYGTKATYYLDLKPGAIASSNKTITFPNKTGTVALTSDIPDMSDYAGLDDLPTITLNGTETTTPNFYAPTTAGTSGYYLQSKGSGAPEWRQLYFINTEEDQISTVSNGEILLNNATTSDSGLMSAADKVIVNGISSTYLPLTGGDLSGNLRLNADSGVGRWTITRQNNASIMSSGVSTSGIHGLYSDKGSRWMIQAPADGSSVTINDGISSNTYIAGNLTIYGGPLVTSTEADGTAYFDAQKIDGTFKARFGCGTNNERHGIYSSTSNTSIGSKWIIMRDETGDIFIGGTTSNYKVHGWVNASASSSNWYYRKFSDGTFDAWGTFTVTPTSSTASGNIYYSNAISVSLPFTVTEANITGSVGAQYAWLVNTSSTSTTVSFRIARGTAISTSTALTVKLHVHGRY